jgi:hypothetical protein
MIVYETIYEAVADVGLSDWLCYMFPVEEEAAAPPSWDVPLSDKQFANVLATAEEEGW